ncbi:efflux RND transporter periplasmic adaptor subunit [Methylocystis parvus]|uniref:Efflux RND transporter periplasmic adaptor subunit n=1 Tax=Methylocystis parvus TaxID=134 RepID=A0A6B8M388_9HYPH|nr:efflux RND transporter periplasmic adaptor subunit [Methylocystis parvus]QGM96768.1 efflux RND transporter periplasmic adaptor subunit [Methylocystis parvus]WBJ99357.1 efflux RND transporter periplasmic adaptor subunit [Methylocystis parvus OBBP]
MAIGRRFAFWGVLLAMACAGVYAWSIRQRPATTAPAVPPAVPVAVAIAQTREVPIILRGLGSVTAYATVDVKSRVVGNIVKVNFREGQSVRAGDLLVQLDPRPYQAALAQANATLARDEANLANARADLDRYAKLVRGAFISKQQFANQQATVSAGQATVDVDKAAVDAARLNVEYCSIASPIDGVVGIRQVDIGNLIQPNAQTLVVVTQLQPIYVVFTLPEADIHRIREAMQLRKLPVIAFNSTDERQISTGVLELIDNQVDQSTGTVKLKATFSNSNLSLWPGQFVNAHLVVETEPNAVVVPSVAVQTGPQGPFVYVVRFNDTVEVRRVVVAQTEHNQSALRSGVQAGERVVVAGQLNLAPDAKVTVTQISGEAVAQNPPQLSDKSRR